LCNANRHLHYGTMMRQHNVGHLREHTLLAMSLWASTSTSLYRELD
jgi:hypothetical protein